MTALALAAVDVAGVHATVVGEGLPVTLFAHGLGGSVAETRPLAARVPGTRVLVEFRGHGRSAPLPGGWDYDVLADDLAAVAGATGATGAVGVSLGSGALLRLLTRDPARFARLALVLPASLDAARADGATLRLDRLGSAIDRADVDAVAALLLDELPGDVRSARAAGVLVRRRAQQLVIRPAPRPRRDDRPLHDRRDLAAVTAPALVVAQRGDPLHRLDVAEDLALALPAARLLVVPPGGVFWTAGRQVQEALAAHFAPDPWETP
ncbi:MAG TPA: alpha/beta hydrolase [Mycobacteriales bacterium]|nr:alpha/beta hydrolase [Mycobacteriales bacterium]